VDLGELATREAALQERVDLDSPRHERSLPVVLAAQRRLLGLQLSCAEQVLEDPFALREARGSLWGDLGRDARWRAG
jgi:hypothetical protein